LAIIATPVLFLAPSPPLSLSASADDVPKAAHEAAVLDRIFANWKARHDRVHSLHFKWDAELTLRTKSVDPLRSSAQLWIDGDDRVCLITTPFSPMPQAKFVNRDQVVSRLVITGKAASYYYGGPGGENAGGPAPGQIIRHGRLDHVDLYRHLSGEWLQPLLIAFRPQYPSISWLREQCRLVEENSPIENGRYTQFRRVVQPPRPNPRREEACWVSPVRDDVVVQWMVRSPPPSASVGSIKYKKDTTAGWIPSEWSCEYPAGRVEEFRVTGYAINEKIDPAIFSLDFPAGTPVQEQFDKGPAKFRYYVVQPDGSKRTISSEEFWRLIVPIPLGQPAPAKPHAK
jgi:hypothetical protein